MTQFWHHPPLIVELLAHQLHFQSTFNAHQSECMHNTTKLILKLKHSKFEHHPSYICPACKILARNPCFFDPLLKFKKRISGAPKKLDWRNQIAQPTNSNHRVMRVAVPIPAVASASVFHSAGGGGSVVDVVRPL